MADEAPNRGGGEMSPRTPTLSDVVRICAELNRLGGGGRTSPFCVSANPLAGEANRPRQGHCHWQR